MLLRFQHACFQAGVSHTDGLSKLMQQASYERIPLKSAEAHETEHLNLHSAYSARTVEPC